MDGEGRGGEGEFDSKRGGKVGTRARVGMRGKERKERRASASERQVEG
jgi:hypothetical protein